MQIQIQLQCWTQILLKLSSNLGVNATALDPITTFTVSGSSFPWYSNESSVKFVASNSRLVNSTFYQVRVQQLL